MTALDAAIRAETERPHIRRAPRPENTRITLAEFDGLAEMIVDWAELPQDTRKNEPKWGRVRRKILDIP